MKNIRTYDKNIYLENGLMIILVIFECACPIFISFSKKAVKSESKDSVFLERNVINYVEKAYIFVWNCVFIEIFEISIHENKKLFLEILHWCFYRKYQLEFVEYLEILRLCMKNHFWLFQVKIRLKNQLYILKRFFRFWNINELFYWCISLKVLFSTPFNKFWRKSISVWVRDYSG